MVLPLVVALLFVYLLTILIALAISPTFLGARITIDTYLFVLQATGLWAGLSWISVAIYISLVSEADDFYFETWLSFSIGSLMIYIALSGVFVEVPYWLGVRAVLSLLLSAAALIMLVHLVETGDLMPPSERFRELYHNFRRLSMNWWRRIRGYIWGQMWGFLTSDDQDEDEDVDKRR